MSNLPSPTPGTTGRLGLLSDTHGDAAVAAAAITLLRDAGATALIHLGDVGTDAVLEELVAFDRGDVHLVFGNCDDVVERARHAERLGLRSHHPAGLVEVDGRRVGFTHGHLLDVADSRLVEHFLSLLPRGTAPTDGRVDYLLHGHTHRRRDERIERAPGTVRVVNPGALHRAEIHTIAVLEPGRDTIVTLQVESSTPRPSTRGGVRR